MSIAAIVYRIKYKKRKKIALNMDTSIIEHIKKLSRKSISDASYWEFLNTFLTTTEDVTVLGGKFESSTVDFILFRTKSRVESLNKVGKKNFGANELIAILESIPINEFVEFVELRSEKFIGTVVIYQNEVLGYIFTNRTGTVSLPVA